MKADVETLRLGEEEMLSPRLRWMLRHDVAAHYFEDATHGEEWMAIMRLHEDEGLSVGECIARHCRLYEEGGRVGYGATEEDALRDLAVNTNTLTWNEEVVP